MLPDQVSVGNIDPVLTAAKKYTGCITWDIRASILRNKYPRYPDIVTYSNFFSFSRVSRFAIVILGL